DDTEREAVELLAVAGELSLNVLAQLVDEDVLERLERRGLLQVVQVGPRTEILLGHPPFADVLPGQPPPLPGRPLRRLVAVAGASRISSSAGGSSRRASTS